MRGSMTSRVETAEITPTILAALGLDPGKLAAVQKEGTQVLPASGSDRSTAANHMGARSPGARFVVIPAAIWAVAALTADARSVTIGR
jgi:hypothetical protein